MKHKVRVWFEDDGRLTQRGVERPIRGGDLGVFNLGEQLCPVIVDGVLGVLEGVSGEDEYHALLTGDLAQSDELFEASQGNGRGGFATNAFSADLGFGESDLLFGDLFAPAAKPVDDVGCLAPGGGVANAYDARL